MRHMVFTLPKRIRRYFQFDRQLLAGIATAAWDAIRQVVTESLGPDTIPGAVLALHTAGETLGWNPHAHLIVADGGFTKDDFFIRMSHWDEAELQKRFSSDLLHLLVERERMDTTLAQQILGQEHTGLSVWCERIVEADDTEGRLFLGRYLAKAPVALERMVLTEDAVIVNA